MQSKTYLIIFWVEKYIIADILQKLGVVLLQYNRAVQQFFKCDDEFIRTPFSLQWGKG